MAAMRLSISDSSFATAATHSATSSIKRSSMATRPALVSMAAASDAATAASSVRWATSWSCTSSCSSRAQLSALVRFAASSCALSAPADRDRSSSAATSRSSWKRRAASSSPTTSSTCFRRSCDRSSCVCSRATSRLRSLRSVKSASTDSLRFGGGAMVVVGASGAASAGSSAGAASVADSSVAGFSAGAASAGVDAASLMPKSV
mmetsp:Transcript_18466/g.64102  ORF Transcript_18466/g.64102 Transcript_18466/m.64102 type:complete len:205 (+) Transcript_18466:729-1343(+)